jgi:hypothetical protein
MRAGKSGELSQDMLRARSRFQAWRRQRTARSPIPQHLWDLAVRLAQRHGVSRTATILGLDYYRLKKRAEQTAPAKPSSPPFVQLPTPVMPGKQCQFELDNGAGAILRVQLLGYDAADLEVLARTLGSAP